MKIFAISDTHFNHAKLVEYGRPANFSEKIRENLSRTKGDLLIHCGDFAIGNDEIELLLYMSAAVGFKKHILVRGNHDKQSDGWYLQRGFDMVCESFSNTYFGKRVLFTHIPVDSSAPYYLNLHGHMHGNTHRLKDLKGSYNPAFHKDLAPEIHNYGPVNLEKLLV